MLPVRYHHHHHHRVIRTIAATFCSVLGKQICNIWACCSTQKSPHLQTNPAEVFRAARRVICLLHANKPMGIHIAVVYLWILKWSPCDGSIKKMNGSDCCYGLGRPVALIFYVSEIYRTGGVGVCLLGISPRPPAEVLLNGGCASVLSA